METLHTITEAQVKLSVEAQVFEEEKARRNLEAPMLDKVMRAFCHLTEPEIDECRIMLGVYGIKEGN